MNVLLSEVRFFFAQCVFMTSCHYSALERYEKEISKRQTIAMVISALTIIILVGSLTCWECNQQGLLKLLSLIGSVLTAGSLIFEIYNRENLSEIAFKHKQSAEDYKALRDQLMDIIRQIKSNGDYNALSQQFQNMQHDYSVLGAYSIQTNGEDYCCAQKKLGLSGNGEAYTWTDEEIDKFLPDGLKGLI